MAVVRKILPVFAALLFCAAQLNAQAVGRITGKVVDSASKQPLSSVTISVDGTARTTLARADGSFDLAGVPAGAQRLRARRIGYHGFAQSVTAPDGGTATVEVNMVPQPQVLKIGRASCRER